jgi:hypothetical protein
VTGNMAAGARRARAASWLDERTTRAAAQVWVRAGLVRMAMRRRDRIPELAVMALDQEARRWPDLDQMEAAMDCFFTNPVAENWVTGRDANAAREAGHSPDLDATAAREQLVTQGATRTAPDAAYRAAGGHDREPGGRQPAAETDSGRDWEAGQ